MGQVFFRQGNIFEGAVDLTVLPCSAKATVSSATKRWIDLYSLPSPEELSLEFKLGQISAPIPFPGPSHVTKWVVYAASVLNNSSSARVLHDIAASLGRLTFADPGLRIVETPLLGTGAGKLETVVAGEALYKGFKPASVADARLYVFVFDTERLTSLERMAASLRIHSTESSTLPPRIFISHSSKDEEKVRKLIQILERALNLKESDIRCSSIPGYTLRVGVETATHLSNEIRSAEVILGVVSPESLASDYVLFELGASWGLEKLTFPLLVSGATFEDLPGPLKGRHALNLDKRANIHQLIENIAEATTIELRTRVAERLDDMVDEFLASS